MRCCFSYSILYKCFSISSIQIAINRLVRTIPRGYSNACKTNASKKCRIAYTRYTVGNYYAFQTNASIECKTAYTRHTIWYSYARQTIAIIECAITYARYAIAYSYAY